MHSLISGIEFILKGGFMMYPLLISALIALTIILERIIVFRRYYQTPATFIQSVYEKLKAGDLKGVKAICQTESSPARSVILAGVENFQNPFDEMELVMKNRAESWVPLLEKRIEAIDTVITAAPLMGLLGTITGMMASFEVLSEKGVNEPNAITGGVAEALIATATGLIIALICLVAYNYLTAQVKAFIYELEQVASRLIEIRLASERVHGSQNPMKQEKN